MSDTTTPISLNSLAQMRQVGEKIAVLTCYDAAFAQLLERAGVDVLLVGDSLGMVLQGHATTLPVRMEDMVYHAACVSRLAQHALRVVDMPYQSYDDPTQALENAQRLVEAGAQVVKLEGGALRLAVVRHLSEHGIPVCAHLGLTPQSIEELGGYRVQGRDAAGAAAILQDAVDLQAAGAVMLVLECVPTALARQVTAALAIPTIGIGAGPHCDGQVLVLHDMLGISSGRLPRFVKNFMPDSSGIEAAVAAYVQAVKTGAYPGPEHAYN